jgi:hypothetical protein
MTVLHAAGLRDGQQAGHGDLAIGTAAAEAGFSPLDGAAKAATSSKRRR